MNEGRRLDTDGAYVGALVLCEYAGESPDGSFSIGRIVDAIDATSREDVDSTADLVIAICLYGTQPADGWRLGIALIYPNDDKYLLAEHNLPQSDVPKPIFFAQGLTVSKRLMGTLWIEARINDQPAARTPIRIRHPWMREEFRSE